MEELWFIAWIRNKEKRNGLTSTREWICKYVEPIEKCLRKWYLNKKWKGCYIIKNERNAWWFNTIWEKMWLIGKR